jgi:hypothetical protein
MIGGTWLEDTFAFPVTIGDSQTDVAVGYGNCLTGTIHALTINYAVSGTTTADCAYHVLPANGMLDIQVVDCEQNLLTATDGTTHINSNIPCDCPSSLPDPAILAVTPLSLDFGGTETDQTLQITNIGASTLSWVVSGNPRWISASPSSGVDNGMVTVTVDRTGLPGGGDYEGVVNVLSTAGTITVPVFVTLVTGAPTLFVSPTALDFGTSTTNGSFNIQNLGGPTLTWNVSNNEPWLSVSPPSGVDDANIDVTVDRTGLVPGPYSGVVSLATNGGAAAVTVTMMIVTTPVATPVEESTWGRVKSLYYGPGT